MPAFLIPIGKTLFVMAALFWAAITGNKIAQSQNAPPPSQAKASMRVSGGNVSHSDTGKWNTAKWDTVKPANAQWERATSDDRSYLGEHTLRASRDGSFELSSGMLDLPWDDELQFFEISFVGTRTTRYRFEAGFLAVLDEEYEEAALARVPVSGILKLECRKGGLAVTSGAGEIFNRGQGCSAARLSFRSNLLRARGYFHGAIKGKKLEARF